MNRKILLIIILIIAALTRILFLGQFPNGFTGDEAQQGYSAYSILKTGKDEWGQVLPIFPRGFGDFKPPLYTYLTIPSVAIFGLTVEAVRLPAAILGILAVLIIFFLTKELLGDEKTALWASFLLAINPWHIQLSRTAFEGSIGVLTFSLGLLFYLRSTQGINKKNLILSSLFWGLTLYTYHSWRIFVLIFISGLIILSKRKLLTLKNWLPILVLSIFIIPLIFNINATLTRSSDVGIASPNQINGYFANKLPSNLPVLAEKLLDNKFFFVGNQLFSNYISYFSPSFYFTGNRSDGTYLNFPYFPLLYSVELVFWIFGIFVILTRKLESKKIIILWLMLAPIGATLAVGGMNANRDVTILPLTTIISSIGLKFILDKRESFKIYIGAILLINFLIFLHFYFITLPNLPPNNLRYGYDTVIKKALEVEPQYKNVIFSKVFTETQIFIAFYGKVDPTTYQQASQDWLRYEKANRLYIDQLESWNLGKFLFQDLDWKLKDSKKENTLFVSKPEDFPLDAVSILDVKNPRGEVIYRLVPTVNNAI